MATCLLPFLLHKQGWFAFLFSLWWLNFKSFLFLSLAGWRQSPPPLPLSCRLTTESHLLQADYRVPSLAGWLQSPLSCRLTIASPLLLADYRVPSLAGWLQSPFSCRLTTESPHVSPIESLWLIWFVSHFPLRVSTLHVNYGLHHHHLLAHLAIWVLWVGTFYLGTLSGYFLYGYFE